MLLAAFLATLLQACAPPLETDVQPQNFDVVFVRYTDAGSDLFLLDSSDNSFRQLTTTPASEEFPIWSPDGSKIAFLAVHGGEISLQVMDMVTETVSLSITDIANPVSWSGDSDFLVTTKHEGESRGLWTYSLVDGLQAPVSTGASGDAYATWSPTAERLAFESTRDGNPEIYAANVDGSDIARLTENDVLDEWPQWSNDGQYIAYASGVEGDKDVWVMRADGSDRRQLTQGLLFGDAYPSWSPDDSSLMITVSSAGGEMMLVEVDLASGATRELLSGAAADWRAADVDVRK